MPRGLLKETRTYEIEIELDGSRLPDDCSFTFNDVPVDRLMRGRKSLFSFDMDFYAGDLRIGITQGTRVLWSADMQVDPDEAKLTRDEYAAMIAECARATFALYRISAVTVPTDVTPARIRSELVTHELIRTSFDAFERAVSRIADQPLRALRATSVQTDILRARHIDDKAISAALRGGRSRPATSSETVAASRLVSALGGRWIPQIAELRRQDSLDVYENRALLGFLRWLDGTLADLSRRLTKTGQQIISETAKALYANRISRWRARVSLLLRRGLFVGLSPEPKLLATSVFRMNPDYAAAFSAMSRMRAGLGTGTAEAPAVPVDRTYQLYELWCYVGFLAAVADRFPDSRAKISEVLRGCRSPNYLGTALARGEVGDIVLNSNLTLSYQRRIAPKPSSDGARTLLIEVVPDISISRRSPDGVCEGIVVLDPKYRAGASLLDGIRDMHVYRDAIVNASGAPLVKAAIALAPRPKGLPEVTAGLPLDRPGILAVRPSHDPATFDRVLAAALAVLQPSSHQSEAAWVFGHCFVRRTRILARRVPDSRSMFGLCARIGRRGIQVSGMRFAAFQSSRN